MPTVFTTVDTALHRMARMQGGRGDSVVLHVQSCALQG